MNRPQWVFTGVTFLLVIGLYAATQQQLFGERKPKTPSAQAPSAASALPTDSILVHAKENLPAGQVARLNALEHSISRGDVVSQKLHIYHQLARFWKDSARQFAPFAWYTAEAARLENSEKSLTFAARLFLEGLKNEEDIRLRQWEALQAKDLFERSLKLNPSNDSSRVNLGAVYVYGGLSTPMEGIQMIRSVMERDSTNVHAHMTLAEASLLSGQLDKALERYQIVNRLQPDNLQAIFRSAELYEQMQNRPQAIAWYKKSFPFIKVPGLKEEVEKRIQQLSQ